MSEASTEGDRVARVHEALEIWNTRGFQAFAEERWSPEIVWEEAKGFPDSGVRHGRDACARRMAERFELLGHVEVEVVDVDLVTDNAVLTEVIIRGRGQASGAPTEMRDWFLATTDEEGRTVRMREFIDGDEARRAADALVAEQRARR